MILLLRGHIRDSFDNDNLYLLVKELQKIDNNIEIFIHTWNIVQSNISWKNIEAIETIVTNEMIYSYFKDLKTLIKNVIIDNDDNIKLIGNLEGNVGNTICPLIGWKRYWYGIHNLVNFTSSLKYTTEVVVLNMRFDILTCSYHLRENDILNFVKDNIRKQLIKNVFINDFETPGIDNIYMGNMNTMKKISDHFYHNLDEIISNEKVIYQEVLVFRENNKLFPNSFEFKIKKMMLRYN